MKIVYVYDSIARIGGMERILTDKMNYLAEIYGHKVYLITSSQGNHPLSFPLSHKVEHIDLDTKFHLQVSIRPRACFFPLFSFLPLWLHYNLNPLCVQY